MELSNFLLTILAGIAGTIVMTATMYLYSNITGRNTQVVHILGAMVTGNHVEAKEDKTKMLITGAISHTFVGVLFSLSYFLLWNWGVFTINWIDSNIVGSLSGIIAIIVWRSYIFVHENAPDISLSHYFFALFISHVIFGVVTVNVYRVITDNPQFWYHLQQDVNEELSLAIFMLI